MFCLFMFTKCKKIIEYSKQDMYAVRSTYPDVSSKFQINLNWHGWGNPSSLGLYFLAFLSFFHLFMFTKCKQIIKSSKQDAYAVPRIRPKVATKFQINPTWDGWENPSHTPHTHHLGYFSIHKASYSTANLMVAANKKNVNLHLRPSFFTNL